MDNLELLEIVNIGLEKGNSLVAIGKELNISESAIRKRFNRLGYKRIDNKFVLVKDDITSNITPKNKAILSDIKSKGSKDMTDTIQPIIEPNRTVLEGNKTDITSNIALHNNDKIQLLLDNIDKLLSLIPDTTINTELKSDIKQVTTLRLDTGVYGAIKDYSTKRNISVTDVVEKALIDYLNNYL